MQVIVKVPQDVADELLEQPAFVEPIDTRGASIAIADYSIQVLQAGALTITLAQGPEVIRKSIEAVRRWSGRMDATYVIEVSGPGGEVRLNTADPNDVDFEALLRQVAGPDQGTGL